MQVSSREDDDEAGDKKRERVTVKMKERQEPRRTFSTSVRKKRKFGNSAEKVGRVI